MSSTLSRAALGAGILLSQITLSNALTLPSTLPGTWKYQGCYNEVGRTLNGASYTNTTTMTDESCISFCSTKGFLYAGTEYASQCFCDSNIAPGAKLSTNQGDCNMACSGNATEPCGGPDRLTLFWSGQTGPQTNPGPANWGYAGCYTEGITGRVLDHQLEVTGGATNMSVLGCTTACQAAGYVLAGLEYSDECWCGNTFTNGGTVAPTTPDGLSGCSMTCAGNLSEYCGGNSRLDVYDFKNAIATITTSATATATGTATGSATATPTLGIKPTVGAYTYHGCQTEGNVTRALTGLATSSDTMTLEYCASACSGYTYFGTEYGRECYCGNAFQAGSVPAPNSDCSFVCPGNIYEYCGAGNRLTTYGIGG